MQAAVGWGIWSRAFRGTTLLILVVMAMCASLTMASTAAADYEQVPEHFGASGEGEHFLNEAKSLAINRTGAGGVQPGSFYVVGRNRRVARFSPGKEGEEPQFEEAWGWGVAIGGPLEGYVRCGPAYTGVANPTEHTYEHCKPATAQLEPPGEQPGQFGTLTAVAVDQATGTVYIRNENFEDGTGARPQHVISVLTATGALLGEGFGEQAIGTSNPPQSIAATPDKLHKATAGRTALAVGAGGEVYVLDSDYSGVENPKTRVMVFKPCTPGDLEHYCYAAGEDIPVLQEAPTRMSFIGPDRVVVANISQIAEYPTSGSNLAAVCTLAVTGQLSGMTTNEATGEVFFFTRASHGIHRLAPCNEGTHQFHELQSIALQPVANEVTAMGVNPGRVWEPAHPGGPVRPAGILYSVDAEAGGLGVGDILTSAPVSVAPTVGGESISSATTNSVTLRALINPRGSEVSYHFEYLNQAEYLANGESFLGPNHAARAPAVDGHLESGPESTVVAVATGLVPDTEYRFRAVAESSCNGAGQPLCETFGAPARFSTYPFSTIGLPDGRAYELVSPAQKHGGEVFPAQPFVGSCKLGEISECKPPGGSAVTVRYPMQAAPSGNSVAYMGFPFSPTEGSAVFNSYVSSRTAQGWATTAMSPPLLSTKQGQHLAYSADLTEDVIAQETPQLPSQPPAPAGYSNLYFQTVASPGTLTPLVTTKPPHRTSGAGGWGIEYAGHSPDFEAQFFAANDTLTGATPFAPEPPVIPASARDLYEWKGGSLSLINVLPGNSAVAEGAVFASASPDAHGFAAGGRRVFWTANGHLYVREDGQITREIEHEGSFLSASANGLEVLLSDGCVYSLLTEGCTDLTQGQGGFLGIAGASEDLSRIYFVDKAALSPEAEAGTCEVAEHGNTQARAEEKEGKVPPGLGCNLYFYEAGTGTRFIAKLMASDGSVLNDWAATPSQRTAEASTDGRYLALTSTARLTGYDNVGPCEPTQSGFAEVACAEVFRYDSGPGSLSCSSCNPTGEAPRGFSTLGRIEHSGSWLPQPRYLTNQGRLFFDSQDRLSPRDVNGRVEDVYEAEPLGVGSCARPAGCVSLISPGTGSVDSNFLAMGGEGAEEGADVFFTTRERLVPADKDELIDLYDARVGGGFASEAELPASECIGESCQSPPSPPTTPSPSSQLFSGPGNVKPKKPAKCSKGKVKKHGKCVKQKHSKKKAGKRPASHKQGGAK
ncbi:MAG: hypothetical protein JSS97_03830 [Actinobacteria bacterium]|nr:hypothetical protein [Actinomycetota bacterium]